MQSWKESLKKNPELDENTSQKDDDEDLTHEGDNNIQFEIKGNINYANYYRVNGTNTSTSKHRNW